METKPEERRDILMGNEAIARGLVEAGVHFMTAYPGTPSSEVLPAVVRFGAEQDTPPYCEWSVNEKVAVEVALAAAYTGKRSACAMKQVGLNVALDPVMSAAYIGVVGGCILISADDPGPHSSQTEQDSRLLAYFAKLPVFDPESPAHAHDLILPAFELSEEFQVPVLFRPTLRVCHARQNLLLRKPRPVVRPAHFQRDPSRWAAIPKMRLALHEALNSRIEHLSRRIGRDHRFNVWHCPPAGTAPFGILASGIAAALARDALQDMGMAVQKGSIPFLQPAVPYPVPMDPIGRLFAACEKVLVLEETEPLLELLAPDRTRAIGRLTGHVPSAGELTPDVMTRVLESVLTETGIRGNGTSRPVLSVPDRPPLRRPNLCSGCSHRAAFFALKKTFPRGVFPGDIGCYTLGLNQAAVDTCHDMGASINFAAAFARAFQDDGMDIPVAATIGDSTFYHSGTTGLTNAVYNGARFVLLILDNETTSMTGMQPTPASGLTADGHPGRPVRLENLVRGCGIEHLEVVDPYRLKDMEKALRRARRATQAEDGGVSVVIARHACVAHRLREAVPVPLRVAVHEAVQGTLPVLDPETHSCARCGRCEAICPSGALKVTAEGPQLSAERCTRCRYCAEICPTGAIVLEPAGGCVGCGLCASWFGCPSMAADASGRIHIQENGCVGCGVCIEVCAHGAIYSKEIDT